MAEPESYEAANQFMKTLHYDVSESKQPRPQYKEEFEMFFFLDANMNSVEGHLRGWMLASEGVRAQLVKDTWGEPKDGENAPSTTSLLRTSAKNKALLWILYQESTHKDGSRLVAQAAFNCLMPKR